MRDLTATIVFSFFFLLSPHHTASFPLEEKGRDDHRAMAIAAKGKRSMKQGAARRVTVDSYATDSSEQIESEEGDEQSSDEESVGPERNSDDYRGSEEDEDESDDDIDEEKDQESSRGRIESQLTASGEQCTFDLRNLVAVNSHQLNASSLYSSKNSATESDITIRLEDTRIQVNEEHLLEKARDGCAQLISAIWQLPTEQSDAGPLVTLPTYFEIKIPRALVSYGQTFFTIPMWAEID